jgi:hypothetical protein
VQKSIAPRFTKTFGEHVVHQQPEEMLSRNDSGLIFFRLGTDIPEGDHPVVALQDIFFLDDAFVKVFPEIN